MPPLLQTDCRGTGLPEFSVDLKRACAPNRRCRAVWSTNERRFTGSRTTFPDCQTVANQAILSS